MPIPQTIRVNPLDLQKNITIGVSLPFNGPFGPFNKTYSTEEQIKYNLINLILTNKGERVYNPEFGTDLRKILFENITDDIDDVIKDVINSSVYTFLPEITISNLNIEKNKDSNIIYITIQYIINISGNSNQITVEFI